MVHRSILSALWIALSTNFIDATSYGELNFASLAALAGYAAQTHAVTTDDGYILHVFRLTDAESNCTTGSTPVLLMHGLLMSADTWLDAGDASLPYIMASDCRDVWVGSTRGSHYGRAHRSLDPDEDAAFWDFSLNELGSYDIPALIDYVRNVTGRDRIDFIGYSQGGGTGLAACAERREYNDRINTLVVVAPATKLRSIKSPIVLSLGPAIEAYMKSLPHTANAQEMYAKGSALQTILEGVCDYADDSGAVYATCEAVRALVDSRHAGSVTAAAQARLFAHLPSGTSTRLLLHYLQLTRADDYYKYDYGSLQNIAVYGSLQAPRFNLSRVTVPVAIFYGPNDYLVVPDDVLWLKGQLPNIIGCTPVNDTMWNHLDVMYSKDIPTKLYPLLKEYLQST